MSNTEPEKSSAARTAERITRNYDAPAIHKDFFAKKYTAIIEQETAADRAVWEQEKVELLARVDNADFHAREERHVSMELQRKRATWEQREKQLVEENRVLKRELNFQSNNNHKRNLQLDALHFVWCDGGCVSGAHRFTEGELTLEIVEAAEHNTKRLRRWYQNNLSKAANRAAITTPTGVTP